MSFERSVSCVVLCVRIIYVCVLSRWSRARAFLYNMYIHVKCVRFVTYPIIVSRNRTIILWARVELAKNSRRVACDMNTTVSTLSLSRRHFCVPWSLSVSLPRYLSRSLPPSPSLATSLSFQTTILSLSLSATLRPFLPFVHTNLRLPSLFTPVTLSLLRSFSPLKRLSPFSRIHAPPLSLFPAFSHRIHFYFPLLKPSLFFPGSTVLLCPFCSRSLHLSLLFARDRLSFLNLPLVALVVLVSLATYSALSCTLLTSGWGTPASSTEGYPVDSTHLHLHQPAASRVTYAWKITHTRLTHLYRRETIRVDIECVRMAVFGPA